VAELCTLSCLFKSLLSRSSSFSGKLGSSQCRPVLWQGQRKLWQHKPVIVVTSFLPWYLCPAPIPATSFRCLKPYAPPSSARTYRNPTYLLLVVTYHFDDQLHALWKSSRIEPSDPTILQKRWFLAALLNLLLPPSAIAFAQNVPIRLLVINNMKAFHLDR